MLSRVLIYLLDTVLIGTSFFNMITMCWLGLTVILNAERRTWGTLAAGAGMLFGAAFFAVHTSVVGQAIWEVSTQMGVWWRVGWAPFIILPYLWYLVMAWYAGRLGSDLHRAGAAVCGALGVVALAMLWLANPLPRYSEIERGSPTPVQMVLGVPAAMLIYPAFSVLCIVLAMVALRRPASSQRFMGDLGRMRARPWLVGASLGLLGVSLVSAVGIGWLLTQASAGYAPAISSRSLAALIAFDLILSALIALVVVLLGQAIAAYEIFTGKALPRGGLARHWWGALGFALGFGLIIGAGTDLPFPLLYAVVLAALFTTLLYAIFTWRTFVARERGTSQIRPFVASQRLYDQWLGLPAPSEGVSAAPFRALCADLLNARAAYLVPLGPLAALAGPPLAFGGGAVPPLGDMARRLAGTSSLCLAVDPRRFGGAGWAIPLWNDRGLAGALLLGERRDGALYTQEEIELARAACERLLDTQASAAMTRRLVALQRQRLAESQILDRRTRQVLHDDVLPKIHAAMLLLQAPSDTAAQESTALLVDVHHQIADLLRELPATARVDVAGLGLLAALRSLAEGDLRGMFDRVDWQVAPGAQAAAAALPALSAEVLFAAAREVMRNAARHGRGGDRSRPLALSIALERASSADGTPLLRLLIADDGVGLASADAPAQGGSGQGLALHTTLLAVLGGTLSAEPRDVGMAFALTLPCGAGEAAPT